MHKLLGREQEKEIFLLKAIAPVARASRSLTSDTNSLGAYRVQEGKYQDCYAKCDLVVDRFGSICRPYKLECTEHPEHAVLLEMCGYREGLIG